MKPSWRRKLQAVIVIMAFATQAAAQPSEPPAADGRPTGSPREHIAAQRTAIEQRYVDQERECAQRFVVTSCMNDARQQRRNALAPLRQEELRIGLAERKQRAATRLEEIEAKQRADAARDAALASNPVANRPASARAAEAARPPISAPRQSKPIDMAERQRREAESEARFNARQVEADRHRADVEKRNAQRAAGARWLVRCRWRAGRRPSEPRNGS